MATSCTIFKFSFFRVSAKSIAPTAPTLAASVGVATPINIEPSTAIIRSTGGNKPFISAPKISAAESLTVNSLTDGASAGRIKATIKT